MKGEIKARWGQPITGIFALATFTIVAWGLWYLFSDPRGPVGAFPYPFVMYLAMMILVGLWQHMFLGDWPFQEMPQPAKGIVLTLMNLILVWLVIHVVFYRVLGLGFNFLSQSNLESLAASGGGAYVAQFKDAAGAMVTCGRELSIDKLMAGSARYAERAVVCFVLIGFFSYPAITILFAKWPIRPSDLKQPMAGLAEFSWASLGTLLLYVVLIVPFWGLIYGKVFGTSFGINLPWWGGIGGTSHVHWVFGWWEWMIVILFMTVNVWRMKPWSAIGLPQPLKGLLSFVFIVGLGYIVAIGCVKLAPLWIPDMSHALAHNNSDSLARFLWYHAAEIAGFTLMPFLAWHHYFDDAAPMKDPDAWSAFGFRTVGVGLLCILNYLFFYYANFGHWGLGNPHMEHALADRLLHGESLIWNFWWIIPLLWNEWFFHKWPFYGHVQIASVMTPSSEGRPLAVHT
jgi:AAT family amino acid transporter